MSWEVRHLRGKPDSMREFAVSGPVPPPRVTTRQGLRLSLCIDWTGVTAYMTFVTLHLRLQQLIVADRV